MLPISTRSARIEARIAPDALTLLRRAAELQGRSLSDFVVEAAIKAANQTIEQSHVIRLAAADQEALAAVLINPPAPNEALQSARRLYAEQVVQG